MILFTYFNSRRFEAAGIPEKKNPEYNYAWLIRDSEAGNIKKQLWLRIPKGITEVPYTNQNKTRENRSRTNDGLITLHLYRLSLA